MKKLWKFKFTVNQIYCTIYILQNIDLFIYLMRFLRCTLVLKVLLYLYSSYLIWNTKQG